MKRFVYILIYPFAILIGAFLEIIAVIWASIKIHNLSGINQYFYDVDAEKDRTGNVTMQYVFNSLLIKSTGYKYGKPGDLISFVTATNLPTGTLRFLGKGLAGFLILCTDPAFSNLNLINPKRKMKKVMIASAIVLACVGLGTVVCYDVNSHKVFTKAKADSTSVKVDSSKVKVDSIAIIKVKQ